MDAPAAAIDVFAHDIAGWAARLDAGEATAAALTDACLERIARHDGTLNAFATLAADAAREAAAASDARRARGQVLGPLDGIPVALKDNIDMAGLPATAGIVARKGRIAREDAAATQRLREAGAVLLGMVTMHEGALGATTESPLFGRTYNPHRPTHTPGGSSGGSGAAVAAGFCLAALGTDTLGSVRIPAAYCGIAGIKTTRGLISPRGVLPLSWTYDHVGPLARSVRDLGLLLDVLVGYDAECPESVAGPLAQPYDPGEARALTGVRLGRPEALDGLVLERAVARAFDDALDVLARLGAEIVPVSFAGYDVGRMRRAGFSVAEAEGAVVHAEALADPESGLSPLFRRLLGFGAGLTGVKLVQAQRAIAEARQRLARAFAEVDAVVLPTTPQTAFDFDEPAPDSQADLTAIANLTDRPAVSVPMGLSPDGLPIGLQVMGPRFAEAQILRYARAYELAADHDMRPRQLD